MSACTTRVLNSSARSWCRASSRLPSRYFRRCTQRCFASKNLPPPDVKQLAQLAHLSVTEQEVRGEVLKRCQHLLCRRSQLLMQVKDWEPKLHSILEWYVWLIIPSICGRLAFPISSAMCRFDQLQNVDVSDVKPALRADVDANNVLRDDIAQECESRHGSSALLDCPLIQLKVKLLVTAQPLCQFEISSMSVNMHDQLQTTKP